MNPSASTIAALLETGDTKATALSSPGGRTLSFGALRSLISRTVETLAARGIGPNDRVAIVLDNGPEMAVAFLSVAALTFVYLYPHMAAVSVPHWLDDSYDRFKGTFLDGIFRWT